MDILRNLYYEFQYGVYARRLPFYMVRHCGAKSNYRQKEIDEVLQKYSFNTRFSPIAYALMCGREDFGTISQRFKPCPSREYIRDRVAAKYFAGNSDFSFLDLMRISVFKSKWDGTGMSINKEYWSYIGKLERKNR